MGLVIRKAMLVGLSKLDVVWNPARMGTGWAISNGGKTASKSSPGGEDAYSKAIAGPALVVGQIVGVTLVYEPMSGDASTQFGLTNDLVDPDTFNQNFAQIILCTPYTGQIRDPLGNTVGVRPTGVSGDTMYMRYEGPTFAFKLNNGSWSPSYDHGVSGTKHYATVLQRSIYPNSATLISL